MKPRLLSGAALLSLVFAGATVVLARADTPSAGAAESCWINGSLYCGCWATECYPLPWGGQACPVQCYYRYVWFV